MSASFQARASHLLRCGVARWPEFHALARQTRPPDDGALIALARPARASARKSGARLDRQLYGEYAALLGAQHFENVHIENDWQVKLVTPPRLSAGLDLDASIGGDGDGGFQLDLSFGLCLGLDDALLTALSIWGFYTDRRAKTDKPAPFAVITGEVPIAGRYFSYRELAGAAPDALAGLLTYCVPLDAMKLAQSDVLLALSLRWIVLHEQAHLLLGHLDWRAAQNPNAAPGLVESRLFLDAMNASDAAESYCLELQADAFATQMLVTLGLSEAMQHAPAIKAYAAARQAAASERVAYAPDLSDRLNMFRSMLLGAGASSLVFEARRQKRDRVSSSHPPPSARILNICTTALSAFGDIVAFETGKTTAADDVYELDSVRAAINAVMTCMVEFEMMAGVLGVADPIYKSGLLGAKDRALGPELASPLTDDLFSLMHPGRRTPAELKTEGARAFVALLDRSKALQRTLAPFSRVGALKQAR